VEVISARFHERRGQRTGFERAMMRLTGMDLKMDQYRKGEEFVAAIARARGAEALHALWSGPRRCPSPQEIRSTVELAGTGAAQAFDRSRLARGTHV